jgi:hypothetical protein
MKSYLKIQKVFDIPLCSKPRPFVKSFVCLLLLIYLRTELSPS